jgi:hypothetical protein
MYERESLALLVEFDARERVMVARFAWHAQRYFVNLKSPSVLKRIDLEMN